MTALAEDVPTISAIPSVQLAENDPRTNAMWRAYEAAVEAARVCCQMHQHPGTQHGLHSNSTRRYQEASAKLAWARALVRSKKHLVG